MNGKRAITPKEYERAREYLIRRDRKRDLVLFSLLYRTGYRTNEVLSIKLSDVFTKNWEVRRMLKVEPRNMKRKQPRMAIQIHPELQQDLLDYLPETDKDPDFYLIQSQKGSNKAISYTQAYRIIDDIFDAVNIYDNVACHSFRKAFCEKIYHDSGGDIVKTQRAMGHKNPETTIRYIGVIEQDIQEIIMSG